MTDNEKRETPDTPAEDQAGGPAHPSEVEPSPDAVSQAPGDDAAPPETGPYDINPPEDDDDPPARWRRRHGMESTEQTDPNQTGASGRRDGSQGKPPRKPKRQPGPLMQRISLFFTWLIIGVVLAVPADLLAPMGRPAPLVTALLLVVMVLVVLRRWWTRRPHYHPVRWWMLTRLLALLIVFGGVTAMQVRQAALPSGLLVDTLPALTPVQNRLIRGVQRLPILIDELLGEGGGQGAGEGEAAAQPGPTQAPPDRATSEPDRSS